MAAHFHLISNLNLGIGLFNIWFIILLFFSIVFIMELNELYVFVDCIGDIRNIYSSIMKHLYL